MKLFREMLAYGSGLLVLNLGSQLVSTSQVIVITRTLGLECASIWAVSTKLSTLVQQFVNRIFETSAAGFVEMLVRNETAQLRRRLRDLVMLAGTLAGLGAVALAIFNQPFLAIWTSGKISWPGVNDSLLGGVVFLYCVSRFHVGFGSLSTDVHKIKYIILAEGALFIGLAFPLSAAFGLTGILMASLSANLLTSFCGSLSITAKHLGLARLAVMSWIAKPAVLVMGLTLVYAAFPAWPGDHSSLSMTLALKSGVFLLLIVPMFLYVGLSDQLRSEILRHISSAIQTISVRFDR